MIRLAVPILAGLAAFAAQAQPTDSDNLIVPGQRIGPAMLNGSAAAATRALGRPQVRRFRDRAIIDGQPAPDIVRHSFGGSNCMSFLWTDVGLDPRIGSIRVTCGRWRTARGIGVGSTIPQVIAAMGQPDYVSCNASLCHLWYRQGIFLYARNRDSPINEIAIGVTPTSMM